MLTKDAAYTFEFYNSLILFMSEIEWFRYAFFTLHYFNSTARCERDSMPPETFQALNPSLTFIRSP
jgi:hypothetical protein